MFRPRLRKVRLKRAFDATLARGVASGAALVIVSSPREREDVVACGVDPSRVRLRGNAFPEPPPPGRPDPLDGLVPAGAPVVLYVGRIAAEKGVEHLLEAARRLPDVHVVLAGPDDRHGTMASVRARARRTRVTAGRIHVLPPTPGPPYDLYRRADVFVLASGGENFGLVAAEAAAVGNARDRLRPQRASLARSTRARRSSSRTSRRRPSRRSRRVLGDDALRATLVGRAPSARRRGRPGTRSSTRSSRSTRRRSSA